MTPVARPARTPRYLTQPAESSRTPRYGDSGRTPRYGNGGERTPSGMPHHQLQSLTEQDEEIDLRESLNRYWKSAEYFQPMMKSSLIASKRIKNVRNKKYWSKL